MRISCLQENLNRGLSLVGRAAATRTTLPITNHVMLSSDQGRLKLVSTNLEMAVSCWVGAKIDEEGSVTIPAKLLTEFVATLPNDKIDMSLPASGAKTLELKCARFEARISGVDAKEFPPIPKVDDGITVKVEIGLLRQAISQVVFAAGTDESRQILTGVCAEFEGKTLTLAAADGFRLAVYKIPLASTVEGKSVAIIPGRSLAELNRLAGDQEEEVEIKLNATKSQILFRLKDVEIVSQLVQGNFPQYNQLIPQSFNTRALVDVGQFLRATKTASIFARDGSGIVRLIIANGESDITPGKLSVSARSEEIGEDTGEIDAVVQGEEAKIAFNGKYLMDLLGAIKEQQVAIEMNTPSSPGVFKPIGNEDYIHVIMPMFVQW
ncbi:MAG: DNA polymerase III subunit beta [Dehalococcoidia bacterium]|nr:DNA polymerase III subunit beta [Dehalococcoidia bacterium]